MHVGLVAQDELGLDGNEAASIPGFVDPLRRVVVAVIGAEVEGMHSKLADARVSGHEGSRKVEEGQKTDRIPGSIELRKNERQTRHVRYIGRANGHSFCIIAIARDSPVCGICIFAVALESTHVLDSHLHGNEAECYLMLIIAVAEAGGNASTTNGGEDCFPHRRADRYHSHLHFAWARNNIMAAASTGFRYYRQYGEGAGVSSQEAGELSNQGAATAASGRMAAGFRGAHHNHAVPTANASGTMLALESPPAAMTSGFSTRDVALTTNKLAQVLLSFVCAKRVDYSIVLSDSGELVGEISIRKKGGSYRDFLTDVRAESMYRWTKAHQLREAASRHGFRITEKEWGMVLSHHMFLPGLVHKVTKNTPHSSKALKQAGEVVLSLLGKPDPTTLPSGPNEMSGPAVPLDALMLPEISLNGIVGALVEGIGEEVFDDEVILTNRNFIGESDEDLYLESKEHESDNEESAEDVIAKENDPAFGEEPVADEDFADAAEEGPAMGVADVDYLHCLSNEDSIDFFMDVSNFDELGDFQ